MPDQQRDDRRRDLQRGDESEPSQRGEASSFGGQRPYARDLYSDSDDQRSDERPEPNGTDLDP